MWRFGNVRAGSPGSVVRQVLEGVVHRGRGAAGRCRRCGSSRRKCGRSGRSGAASIRRRRCLPCPEERRPAEILKVQAGEVQVDEPLEEFGLGQVQRHGRQAEPPHRFGLRAELQPDPGGFARPVRWFRWFSRGRHAGRSPCRCVARPPCRNVS